MNTDEHRLDRERCEESYKNLYKWVNNANYKGWDVFDGLNSKLFRKSPFYRSSFLRLAWIQFFKRSPVNLRKLSFVPKGYNAKALGLFASGLIGLRKLDDARRLLDVLMGMNCSGYAGISWGYNFDWQARAFYVPVGKPNMVTTVFVANAFLDYLAAPVKSVSLLIGMNLTGQADKRRLTQIDTNQKYLKIAEGACKFILNELVVFEDNNRLCFGYIPGEDARVHNANMLGAALLGRVYEITMDEDLLDKSRKAMAYSVEALNNDGSWPYGERSHHRFVDNFHTGFNLVSLKAWMDSTGEDHWEKELQRAYHFFLKALWLEDGRPKYYNNSLYPIDIHCSAQGIVTCLKLKEYDERSLDLAKQIAIWPIENMQDKTGFFYYQKTRWYTNKIPYIRWSQAWMFYALSRLLHECCE